MRSILSLSVLLGFSFAVPAEVVTDGSLGVKLNLPGPDFQVEAKLGQQVGGNLFHSFQDFNLQSHESATFSGPNNVQNVISRVTGGNPSNIDGLIRSTIPNADLYLLNPYGIMFGPNAQLDVQGGFHVSTADYLRLQDGGRFEARQPSNSLLTVAPVAAFGFLTETPAAIKTQDSQLSVSNGNTFSWIGGRLEFKGNEPPIHDEGVYGNGGPTLEGYSWLLADAGRFNLASVASSGEVIPTATDLKLQAKGGNILVFNTDVTTHHYEGGGGSIFIRGGQFEGVNSEINNNTLTEPGGIMDIQVDNLILRGEDIHSSIESNTYGTGSSGSIHLKVAEQLNLTWAGILVDSYSDQPQAGAAGNLTIQAREVNLKEAAWLSSATFSTGQGGTLSLQVSDTLTISGIDRVGYAGGIYARSQNEELENTGAAGNLIIQARNVKLADGARLLSSTHGTGQGGTISLKVSETLAISEGGVEVGTENSNLENAGDAGNLTIQARDVKLTNGAQLSSSTFGTGHAGNVMIQARQIDLTDGGQIHSATWGTGQAGMVHLHAETLTLTGAGSIVATSSENEELANAGAAGNLQIEARQVVLTEGGKLSSGTWGTGPGGTLSLQISGTLTVSGRQAVSGKKSSVVANSRSTMENAGQAGQLNIQANTINILKDGEISTQSENAGGGNIEIISPNLLYLRQGQITTSVKGGRGNGGNITIEKPQFVILNQGQIKAQADEGRGGNIHIVAEQFIPSTTSLVSASSRLGIDGNVEIDAPDETVSDCLLVLPGERMDASALLKRPCSDYVAEEERSHFYIEWTRGRPLSPEGRQGSLILPVPKVRF